MEEQLIELLTATAHDLKAAGILQADKVPPLKIEHPRDRNHGNLSSNMALILAKSANMQPRQLAQIILDALPETNWLEKIEIAGPGFLNFFLKPQTHWQVIAQVLEQGSAYGCNQTGQGVRIHLEFVSANPTGPLHVGHGRGAAYGDSLANLLKANGYWVHREYYLNDYGRQIDILTVSVWLRYLELGGERLPFPASGYQGDYIFDIATRLRHEVGNAFYQPASQILDNLPDDEEDQGDKEIYIDALIKRCQSLLGKTAYRQISDHGLGITTDRIDQDLQALGVEYDQWFSESTLMENHTVAKVIAQLQDHVYKKNGAWWLRSTAYGDEKDRVIQRNNTTYTYFASDIAYHINKFERGFKRLINIWGADHHGYIARIKAAIAALGKPADQLEIFLVQFAKLYQKGQPIKMSTRLANYITLSELLSEVGRDGVRFFYLMRKPEQHMNFDLGLAKSQSNDNPVYYIQYAHARVSTVFEQLTERGLSWDRAQGLAALERLTETKEQVLLEIMGRYARLIIQSGQQQEPHRLSYYLQELAHALHTYYNAHRFIVDDSALRNARLCLIKATQQIIYNGLTILGVSAPDRM